MTFFNLSKWIISDLLMEQWKFIKKLFADIWMNNQFYMEIQKHLYFQYLPATSIIQMGSFILSWLCYCVIYHAIMIVLWLLTVWLSGWYFVHECGLCEFNHPCYKWPPGSTRGVEWNHWCCPGLSSWSPPPPSSR